MPRCEDCRKSVPAADLKRAGRAGQTLCSHCRGPKEVIVAEKTEKRKTEKKKKTTKKKTQDGATDHEIEADITYAGLEVKFTTTFDQVREFFTQKRTPGQKAKLKSVK